jgi:hypothetical protein
LIPFCWWGLTSALDKTGLGVEKALLCFVYRAFGCDYTCDKSIATPHSR